MPVYTLNPSHTRSGTHKASASHSLRERVTLRRNSASSADGSETYYPTSSSSSSSSSSSTQRSRAATSAATAVANAQARRYAAEASGYMGNPRAKTPTRKDELMRLAHEAGYHVETYSPGDGVTRYRFFDLAEMDRKGVTMRDMSYFGPLDGGYTVLGLAAAKKWLSYGHPYDQSIDEDGMTVSNPATAYNVYLGTKLIDTVFQSGKSDADEVRRSLIDHDGYDHRIRVVKARRHNPLSEDGMTVSNPKRPSYKMVGVAKPRSRSGGTAQKAGLAKGQSLMARAAAAYRAGEYASMQEALRGVARGGASRGGRKNPLSEDGAVVSNPRRNPATNLYGTIRAGDRVTIVTAQGKQMVGRATMRGPAGWVLNVGGRFGTPAIASEDNVVKVSKARSNPLSEDGAVVSNPRRKGGKGKAKRSGGRTAAQSNAARAMKLFHSGQASSLAEAWDIIRSGR